ncbi:RNA polymerase sigma factor [Achromobacter deleyi]|uniref:RNA polymerase sigma factor n=1 Tax=Achromobacter deleyi TaxID=1353891 RepID=UPI001467404D|nr:RNA polymerase sigma factor [Achromobacter deleyi]CAB3928913.1 putative RNA polymerase sigma factor FecI [Achromobacter deleyi]
MMPSSLSVLRDFMLQRYDDLKARLTRRLGCPDLASDALQDTWLRLEAKDDLGPVDSPGPYLMRMAVNVAVDQQRVENRRLTVAEAEVLLNVPDPAPGPDRIAEGRAELDALTRAMGELPARQRVILLAVRLEGLPQNDIAEQLGVSLRTVERELRNAHEYCARRTRKLLSP